MLAVNTSTSVHPFGAGFAVPPGRDTAPDARAESLARASAELARIPANERAQRLRALVQSWNDDALAEWLAEQVLGASPEAAAATNGLDSLAPPDELDTLSALPHMLTDSELAQFRAEGFFVVRGALDQKTVTQLLGAADRLDACFRPRMGIAETERMDLLDCVGAAFATDRAEGAGQDHVGSVVGQAFLNLVDTPTTFPKVWGLMGPNISLYHTQISVQPPLPSDTQKQRLGWHRDSGRLNSEIDGNAAMVSLKVGYFLTNASASTGFTCVPGSHLPQADGQFEQAPLESDPPSAVSVSLNRGDAIIFDRRILHAGEHYRHLLFAMYPRRRIENGFENNVAHSCTRPICHGSQRYKICRTGRGWRSSTATATGGSDREMR